MRASLIFAITLVGLAIIGGAGYFGYRTIQDETAATPPPPNTIPAQRGDVKLTVTAPGQLAGVKTETVRAPAATTILEVLVRPGDLVKKNDVIARVDPEPLRIALEKAQDAAAAAREQLEDEIESAEEMVRKAQDNLNSLQLNYPTAERVNLDLSRAEDALDDAESAQSKAKKSLDSARKTRDARKSELNAANSAVSAAQTTYNAAAADLASSQAAKALAQTNLITVQANQTAAQAAYDTAVTNGEPPEVIAALLAALNAANQAVIDAQTALDAADAEVQADQQAANNAQSDLLAAQSDQVAAQTAYNTAESAYQSANTAHQQTQSAVDNAEYSLELAQLAVSGLKTQQLSADIEIAAARRSLEQARADLTKARANTIDAGLTDAVSKAQLALANATLHASFDGIVKEVNHEAGEDVQKDEPIATILDPNVLEVKSTVVEEDLPLISPGLSADLFFDAAPDAQITGVVDRIVPERAEGSDRTVYTVYIRIDEGLPEGLLPGMTVDGSVIIEQRTDVLILPRALVRAGGNDTAIIEVWDGAVRQKRTVTIGLRGDVNVEILDGLQEGELVVSE